MNEIWILWRIANDNKSLPLPLRSYADEDRAKEDLVLMNQNKTPADTVSWLLNKVPMLPGRRSKKA